MKHYKILRSSHGPWKNLQRPEGHKHEAGDIILASEIDGKINVKNNVWALATKEEIATAKGK